ncbi:MAG TPA: DUF3426 domain-containing protein [Gammaproteobacteria bacterium]|nr:DUF3426 domain-containing protein [Gammaproteobacteria bacterium]
MFTQCQHCESRFEIDISQLKVALGVVNCGRCKKEFNALETLHDEQVDDAVSNVDVGNNIPQLNKKAPPLISQDLSDELIASTEANEPEWVDISVQNDSKWDVNGESINREKGDIDLETVINEEREILNKAPASEVKSQENITDTPPPLIEGAFSLLKNSPTPEVLENNDIKPEKKDSIEKLEISESLLDKLEDDADEFVSRESGSNTLGWSVAIVAMIALLAFQYVYAARNQLAEHDGLRAPLETMCSVLGCSIPLKKSVDQIQLLHKSVQGDANVKNALVVSATYINNAPFIQPYPILELVLSDIDQQVVVSRQFYPYEYLVDKESIEAGISPKVSAQVLLEIVDPGRDAVNFEFNFL